MNKIKDITFASALKAEKKRLGWTWPVMSEKLNIPIRTLEQWAGGGNCPEVKRKYILEDLAKHGRHIKEIKFQEFFRLPGFEKIFNTEDCIPLDVIEESLSRIVNVAVKNQIIDDIKKRMGK